MSAPMTSEQFDRAYRAPLTFWGDIRIPEELKALAREGSPRSSLELGCGVGRFTRYLARQGLRATGVDFSPVAIAKAKQHASGDNAPPDYQVGDVTRLSGLTGPYDFAFDVGCFHCLYPEQQRAYVSEVSRLLKPGGVHLLWALDTTPSDLRFTPDSVRDVFAPHFTLREARKSRRRLVASHWYWLVRAKG